MLKQMRQRRLKTQIPLRSIYGFLGLLCLSGVGTLLSGCAGPIHKVSAEEEKSFRHPPKGPPPGYGGSQMGAPPAPPANPK